MVKKLENLLNRTRIEIVKNDACKFGRFTMVSLIDSKGHEAIGVARRSELDREDDGIGIVVARGRAERALYNKLNGREIHHHYMG